MITAHQAEAALMSALVAAGFEKPYLITGYSDSKDCSFIRVVMPKVNDVVWVSAEAMQLPLDQFAAEVLQPFVAQLLKDFPRII